VRTLAGPTPKLPSRESVQCPSTNHANSRHAMPQAFLRRCTTVKHTVDSYTKLLTTVTVGPTLKRQDFQTCVNSSLNPPRARLAWKFASLLVLSAALTSRTNHTQPITIVPRLQPRESQTRPSRSTKSSKHTSTNKIVRACLRTSGGSAVPPQKIVLGLTPLSPAQKRGLVLLPC